MRVLLAASLVLSLGVHPAFGGAWTQQAGGYYLKLQTGYLNSTEDLDANGDRGPKGLLGGSFKDVNYSAYVEYGLIEGTTLVATLPYKRLDDEHTFASGTAREKRSGFGDLELRLRQRIREGPVVLSVAVGGKIPLWYEDDPETRVPLSSRKVDFDGRFLVGRSLYPLLPGYVTGEAGFRLRGGDFSHEGFYGVEGGVFLGPLLVKATLSGILTTGDCVSSQEVKLIGDQNVLKISPGLIYRFHPRLEFSVDLFHIASGCNTAAGNTLFFAVALKR